MPPGLHHVELWVIDMDVARREWAWLLERVGFVRDSDWAEGSTWSAGDAYLTITSSPHVHGDVHDRRMPGLNHWLFTAELAPMSMC